MFGQQQKQSTASSVNGRDRIAWYPLQASPSQDMWELPTTAATTSFATTDDHEEHGFSPRFRRDEPVEDFSMHRQHSDRHSWPLDDASEATTEENRVSQDPTTSYPHHAKKRAVLGDATNTVRRRRTSSLRSTVQPIRRSNFA
jgi:hypothetical protein